MPQCSSPVDAEPEPAAESGGEEVEEEEEEVQYGCVGSFALNGGARGLHIEADDLYGNMAPDDEAIAEDDPMYAAPAVNVDDESYCGMEPDNANA
jgi:hypothetical protein